MSLDGDTHAMNMGSFARLDWDKDRTGSLPRLRRDSASTASATGAVAGWRPAVFVGPNSRGVRLSGDGDAFSKIGNDRLRQSRTRRAAASAQAATTAASASRAEETRSRRSARESMPSSLDPTTAAVEERRRARQRRREGFVDGPEGMPAAAAGVANKAEAKAAKTGVLGSHKGLVILAAIALILISFYGPVREWYVSQRRAQDLQVQYDQLNAANGTLQGEVDALQTKEGIEDAARAQGYVEQGETAVTIVNGPDTDGTDSTADSVSGTISGQQDAHADTDALTDFLDGFFQYSSDNN